VSIFAMISQKKSLGFWLSEQICPQPNPAMDPEGVSCTDPCGSVDPCGSGTETMEKISGCTSMVSQFPLAEVQDPFR
jgi:hypothetical protein